MDEIVGGHGGAREGAGRKPEGSSSSVAIARFNEARARHEEIKAEAAALDLSIRQGQHLPRDKVQAAAAVAVAGLVQAMRSLGPSLERELSLAPEVAAAIEARIDDALADLSRQFKALAGD